VTDGQQTMSFI